MLNINLSFIPAFGFLILFVLQGSSCGQQSKTPNLQNGSGQANTSVAKEVGQRMNGKWGGQGVAMEIGDKGGTIEFDCAHGTISERITANANGTFAVKGTFIREHPGPIRKDEDPQASAVTYSGTVDGENMTLTISPEGNGETLGTYKLTQGKEGRLRKCG